MTLESLDIQLRTGSILIKVAPLPNFALVISSVWYEEQRVVGDGRGYLCSVLILP